MNSKSLVASLLAALAIGTCLGSLVFHRKEERPSRWMSDVMISRAGTQDTRIFDDQSHIHGLKFFFFKTKNSRKFIDWLELHRRTNIPSIFEERIRYLRSQVDWQFDWNRPDIYSIYYCNGAGQDWTVDLVMVDGMNVIYMTTGYGSTSAIKVDDFEACHPSAK